MENIQGKMNQARMANGGTLSDSVALKLTEGSRDEWGNALIYVSRTSGKGSESIFVSKGADGALDVKNVESYFESNWSGEINNTPEHDIVFRNGIPLTRVGK
jgi:hypothetical protein